MEADRRAALARMLACYAESRDPRLRAQLVEAYEGLAAALARRYGDRRESPDDMRQVALIGLLRAIDGFDPSHGTEFSTYAWATIIGALRRAGRDRTPSVRVSRRVQARSAHVGRALDLLTQRHGRSPTIPELAAATNMSVEEVADALEVQRVLQPLSLDADLEMSGALTAVHDDGLDRVEDTQLVTPLLNRLPERERRIIQLRFNEQRSQSEIAEIMGVSQMHVSRLLARSLQQLRQWVSEDGA
jgi:RNA polymerase sigma-B factor